MEFGGTAENDWGGMRWGATWAGQRPAKMLVKLQVEWKMIEHGRGNRIWMAWEIRKTFHERESWEKARPQRGNVKVVLHLLLS